MRVPSAAKCFVLVSSDELDEGIRVATQLHQQGISRHMLEECANVIGKRIANHEPARQVTREVLLQRLPNESVAKRTIYDDAIRVIFGKRDQFAAEYAHAQGWEPPAPSFKRIPVLAIKGVRHAA